MNALKPLVLALAILAAATPALAQGRGLALGRGLGGPPAGVGNGPPAGAGNGPPAGVVTGPPAGVVTGPPAGVVAGPPASVVARPPASVIIGPPMGIVGPPGLAGGGPPGLAGGGPPGLAAGGPPGLGGGGPPGHAGSGPPGLGGSGPPGQSVRAAQAAPDTVQTSPDAARALPNNTQTPPGSQSSTAATAASAQAQSPPDQLQPAQDSVGRPGRPGVALQNTARDDRGQLIVRDEVLAVSPSRASLAIALRMNFTVARRDSLGALGISSATLRVPQGMDAVDALAALRRADPGGAYDYAHIYNPSGGSVTSAPGLIPGSGNAGSGLKLGMIDGGIEEDHPAFQDANLVTRGFAQGSRTPATSHGTAVASLLVGRDAGFSGYVPAAKLYAADVFGGAPDGGSADNIARALNWLASKDIAVTNISLAGPPNLLLAAVVKAYVASGHVLVAATGNNGPAAPPSFPAAYPGVIAVTSVDSARHLEIDASFGPAKFAALGVNVRAATIARGYAGVTGTSFAVPLVTARFALLLRAPDAEASKAAFDLLLQAATPLNDLKGAPGYLDDSAFLHKVRNLSADVR